MSSNLFRLERKTWAVAICSLAFALLIYQLGQRSVWGDEAYTARVVQRDLESTLVAVANETYPPVYYVCIWGWKTLMGSSEFALRFPSVFFGMLSISILYPLGTRMMSRRIGLLGMGLMAISPFFVMYSRMARYFSLLLFLSLMSYWFFMRLLDDTSTGGGWKGYVISSALAIYTHYLAAFVLVAQAVIALTRVGHRRQFALRFLASQAIIVLLFAPWLGLAMQQAVRLASRPDSFASGKPMMWLLSVAYPFFVWLIGETIYPWNPAAFVGAILAGGLAIRGLLGESGVSILQTMDDGISKEHAQRGIAQDQPLVADSAAQPVWKPKARDFPVLILLPLLLTAITMGRFISGGAFLAIPSRAIFCLPFIYLLIARGLCMIVGFRRRLLAVAGLGIVLGLSLGNYHLGREFHNPNYILQIEDLVNSVVEQAEPGDVFVSDFMTGFDYYIKRSNPEAAHFLAHHPASAKNYVQEHQSPRVWLVLLCRAVETESLATVELVPWLVTAGYSLDLTFGHAPQDQTLARVQELLLGRPACSDKVIIYSYTRLPQR